jgi:hypothetical protein
VKNRLVTAGAELLEDLLGDPDQLVGCDGDVQ